MCRCQSTGLSCDLLLKLLHILLPCTYGHPAVTSVQASVLFMVALCNRADHIYLWPPYVIGGIIFLPCSFLMAALCNRGAIIFLPCDFYLSIFMVALCNRADHYIFILFLLLSSSSFFFSSPNLSGRRLDVYHTLAHSVALVRI